MNPRRFTAKDRDAAVQRIQDGEEMKEVASEVGIAPRTLQKWCNRHGMLQKKVFSKNERDAAVQRTQQGESLEKVVADLGIAMGTLRRWANERGIYFQAEQTWPEEVKEEAIRRVNAGATYTAVGKEMDIPMDSLRYWCVQANAKPSPLSQRSSALRKEAIRRVQGGETYTSISRSLHVSPMAICKWCKKEGVKPAPRSVSPPNAHTQQSLSELPREELVERVVYMVRAGATYAAAARNANVSLNTVSKWCAERNVVSRTKKNPALAAHREIEKRFKSGHSISQIARDLRLPYTNVQRLCIKMKECENCHGEGNVYDCACNAEKTLHGSPDFIIRD